MRAANRVRTCRLCISTFQRARGSFDVICPRCFREQDNQTLEEALAMPALGGSDIQAMRHTASCRALVDASLDCGCGATDVDLTVLGFSEVENF